MASRAAPQIELQGSSRCHTAASEPSPPPPPVPSERRLETAPMPAGEGFESQVLGHGSRSAWCEWGCLSHPPHCHLPSSRRLLAPSRPKVAITPSLIKNWRSSLNEACRLLLGVQSPPANKLAASADSPSRNAAGPKKQASPWPSINP